MRGISSPVRVTQKGSDSLSLYCPVRIICLEIHLYFLTGVVSWLTTLPKPPLLVASINIKICKLPLLLIKTIKSWVPSISPPHGKGIAKCCNGWRRLKRQNELALSAPAPMVADCFAISRMSG